MSNSVRSIFKTTALFGGVQIWKIVFAALRTKVAAVLIGSAGIGLLGVYNSVIGVFVSLTNLGIDRSGVQAISTSGEDARKTIYVLRRLSVYTGTVGMLLFIILSRRLSNTSFGDTSHASSFIFLSLTILLNQIHSVNLAVLRARRQLRRFAKSNLLIALAGFVVFSSVFYFMGIKGVPIGIVLVSLISLSISYRLVKDKDDSTILIYREEFKAISSPLVKLGVVLSISGFIASLSNYVIRILIVDSAGLDIAGIYDSGFTLIGTYFGFIFTGLTTDYYPKLAAISSDHKNRNKLMNEQSLVTVLLVLPLVLLLLLNLGLVIKLLYTEEFMRINQYVNVAVIGVFFKALSYPLGVLLISLGDKSMILLTELIANIVFIFVALFLIDSMPLYGAGIAYVSSQFIMLILNIFLTYTKYAFSYSKELIIVLLFSVILLVISVCYFATNIPSSGLSIILSSGIVLVSLIYINYKTKYIKIC